MTTSSTWRTPMVILIAGAICALIAFGLRASLGLFLKPMSMDLGWGRETFAIALAIQILMWGAFQPFAAAAAEKWGTGRIITFGGVLYASGLYLMSISVDPLAFQLSAGLMVGMAQSGCALAVVLGAVARAMPENRRSWGLGIVTAAGAAGQFTVVPLGQVFLGAYGWSTSYTLLALIAIVILVCAIPLQGKVDTGSRNKAGKAQRVLVADPRVFCLRVSRRVHCCASTRLSDRSWHAQRNRCLVFVVDRPVQCAGGLCCRDAG